MLMHPPPSHVKLKVRSKGDKMKSLILLTSLFTISCTTTQGTRELSSVARTQNAADALVAECEVVSDILEVESRDEKAIWEKLMEKDTSGRMKIENPECVNRAVALYESTCQSYKDLREIPACEILFIVAQNERALEIFGSLNREQQIEIHFNLEGNIRQLIDARRHGVLGTREQLVGGLAGLGLFTFIDKAIMGSQRLVGRTRTGLLMANRVLWGASVILVAKSIYDIFKLRGGTARPENEIIIDLGNHVLDPKLDNNDRIHLIRMFVNETNNAANAANQNN